VPGLRAVDFLEHLGGDLERFQAGRNAAIGSDLHQNLLDLVARDAVGQGGAQVEAKFGASVERSQHRQVDHAARLAREAGARPDHSPGDLGGHLLKRCVEVVGARDRGVDIVGAEHGATHLQPLLEQVALVFGAVRDFRHRGAPSVRMMIGLAR
jgi:hypothetical protein